MAESRVLEWDPEGDGTKQVRFHRKLPAGVQLDGTPTVVVQKRTSSDPETWVAASGVTVSGEAVVNAVKDDGVTLLGTNQAVQFVLKGDADPDTPPRGDNYRVMITVSRSDGASPEIAKNPLRIRP